MSIYKILLSSFFAVLLSACGASGQYFEKSPEEVAKALKGAKLPIAILGRNVVGETVTNPTPNTFVITANDELGGDIFRIVATIAPDGNGTRVTSKFEQLHKTLGSQDTSMAQKAADEQIASTIEGRAFDMMFATSPAAKAVLSAQGGKVQERINAANETMVAFSEMEREMAAQEKREKFEKEYGEDWGASGSAADGGWGN